MSDTKLSDCLFYVQFGEKRQSLLGVNPSHRSFRLSGWIWNTEDGRILGKRVDLTIARGDWTRLVSGRYEARAKDARERGHELPPPPHLVENAIGQIKILKNAEPAQFEVEIDWKNETFEEPPFQAEICLGPEAYSDAEKVCDEAVAANRTINASLRVASAAFPQRHLLSADALDYSAEIVAHVIGIDLSRSIVPFPPAAERPVRVPDVQKDEKRTTIDVVLSEVSASYSMPLGHARRIGGEGKTRNFRAEELHDLTCSVDFTEYERDDAGLYPEKQFPGNCAFYSDGRWFSVSLRYRAADLNGAIGAILAASRSDTVALSISVVLDPEALKAGDQDLRGDVTYWDVQVSRRIGTEAPRS